jgi:HEPN domain-containing protein
MKEITRRWIEYSERDFNLAKELLPNEYYANHCVYHSEQAIEKIIKAVLEEKKIRFPKIHSVRTLFSLLPDNVKTRVEIEESELDLVDDIFVESKYPPDIGTLPTGFPSIDDAKQIFEIAETIYHPLLTYLKTTKNK